MKNTKIAVVVCAAMFASCSESAEDGTETNSYANARVKGKVYVAKNDPQNQNCTSPLPAKISECSEMAEGRAYSCYDDINRKRVFLNVSQFPACFSELTETSAGDLTKQEIIAAVPKHVWHPVRAPMSAALSGAVLRDSTSCNDLGVKQETKNSIETIFVPICVRISYTDTQSLNRDFSSCSIDTSCAEKARDLVPVDIKAE